MVGDIEKGDINGSSDEVDESIATLKLAAESVTVRVLRETADEQARVITVMRSTIDAKDLKIQKLYRKIERRDKRVGKLSKRVEHADTALSKADWSKPEAMMEVETKLHQNMKVMRERRPALSSGLCTKRVENCIRLVDENQQLRDRLHEVDGLCIRLRTECGKLENKIRELEMKPYELRE